MPRKKTVVKDKSSLRSLGLVDLHFHGAFGIDLMQANPQQMNSLSSLLWREGIAAFCPTTLSMPPQPLLEAVARIGEWIHSGQAPGALPLGIHLEGPFVHPGACGAHPPEAIRPLDLAELDRLWEASRQTLKILTVAPETLEEPLIKSLVAWSRKRHITLSLGHSRATEEQARRAFDLGFTNVTHAWNALAFHHRAAGPLGAALGRPGVYTEVILDQVHVSPTVIRWTLDLHPQGVCFVSDCVPAAATKPGSWHSFGNLQVEFREGACRLPGGHLAGGGKLLSKSYLEWLDFEAKTRRVDRKKLMKETLACLTEYPLKAIKVPSKALAKRRVFWQIPDRGPIKIKADFDSQ